MLGMRRRQFITLAGGAVMAWPLTARAQQRGKVPRLGVLLFSNPQTDPQMEVLRSGLRDLGYDDQSLSIFYRYAEGKPERLADLAAALLREKPDLVLALGGDVAPYAVKATSTIPIVFVSRSRPTWAHREPCSACRQRHRRHAPSGRYCFETFGVPQGGGAARTTPRVLMESGSSRR